MKFDTAPNLKKLPPYLFARLDEKKQELIRKGVDLIDLGVGDPDIPTPPEVIAALKEAADDPECHRYPTYKGDYELREEVCQWYKRRFGVKLDPSEVLILIGSKEGIAHLPMAFVSSEDIVLTPDPAYPVYNNSTIMVGGYPHKMKLVESLKFNPNLDEIPEEILSKTKIMWLNYPNNPTSAKAAGWLFKKAVELANKYGFIVAHDAAYTEIYFGEKPVSFLQTEGAKEVGVEFHSLSKTYNMTGWRIGFVVGNKSVIEGLGKVKSNIDSGVFKAVQRAAKVALTLPEDFIKARNSIYRRRREILVKALKETGWKVFESDATFYVWASPPVESDVQAAEKLLEHGIVATPGSGFGDGGAGFIRFALTTNRIEEAAQRLGEIKW